MLKSFLFKMNSPGFKLTKVKKAKKKIANIILSSTIHGLPSVFRTDRLIIKIIWLSLFLICSAFGIYMIIDKFLTYLKFEVVTKIDVIPESSSEFPTITFYSLKHPKSNYPLNDIIIDCKFNDYNCTVNDFDVITDEFGNVYYQFNTIRNRSYNKSEIRRSNIAGKINGFILRLFGGLETDNKIDSDSDYYSLDYNPSNGFHVIVHNHSHDPQIAVGLSYDGIDIPIGFETTLIVNRVFTYKQPEPYNSCEKDLNSINAFDSDLFRLMMNSTAYIYRQKDCFEYCLTKTVTEFCNLTNELARLDIVYVRFFKNETHKKCIDKIYDDFVKKNINEECSKYCPLECDTIAYYISTSSANFPSNTYVDRIIDDSKIKSKYPAGYNLSSDNLKNSLLAFNIYYQDLSYSEITQIPKSDIIDLVSGMGGLLGLFIGVSFLSFAEVIEVILEIIFILFEK